MVCDTHDPTTNAFKHFFEDSLIHNTMRTVVINTIIVIWFHSTHMLDNPFDAIKPHPIWKTYIENWHRKYMCLSDSQPLPENKWSNHLLMNVTQLKVRRKLLNKQKQRVSWWNQLCNVPEYQKKWSLIKLQISVIH